MPQIKTIKSSPKQVWIWSGWPKLHFRVLILIARKYCEIKMITYVLWKQLLVVWKWIKFVIGIVRIIIHNWGHWPQKTPVSSLEHRLVHHLIGQLQNHTTQNLFPLSSQVGINSNENNSLQLLHQILYGWFVISSLETRLMMAEKVKYSIFLKDWNIVPLDE